MFSTSGGYASSGAGPYKPDDDFVIVPFGGTYVRVPRESTEVIKRLLELENQRQDDIGKKLGD
jgi:hypothetical protein